MKIKYILTVSVIVFSLLLSSGKVHAAETPVYVTIDGKVQKFSQPPLIVNDSTLVPLRGIFEALGAKVFWDEDTQTVYAYKDGTEISLTIGSKKVYKNKKEIELQVPAQLINETTMVPVRFIGESLGGDVKWDDGTSTVIISSSKAEPSTGDVKLTAEDIGKFQDRVVYIEVNDANGKPIGSGSGVVVTKDGGIITNYHVIDDAASVKVEFSNHTTFTTNKILNLDISKDLAYIKIEAFNLPVVTFADSSTVKLGEEVVAIGSPLGLKNTLSTGVISATDREIGGHAFIQTSAPIDHGSSGGALFNMYGKVIGITSAGLTSQASLNLAIPSNLVTDLLKSPEKPAIMKPVVATKITNADDLATYIFDNFSYINYEDVPLHFDVEVLLNDDGHYDVFMDIYDLDEFFDMRTHNYESNYSYLPTILTAIAQEVVKVTGDTKPIVSIWLDYNHGTKYPTAFPAESIKVNKDGTFQIFHEEGAVLIDTVKKTATFFPSVDTGKKPTTIPLE